MKKNKIIIWGLPLHSHTHSYIHDCFHSAFKSMGFETYWVTDTQTLIDNSFLNDSIIIVCGVDCETLPVNDSAFYVLHNTDAPRFRQSDNWLRLQVYTKDTLLSERHAKKIATFTYWQEDGKTLYQPWATDLLPSEMIYDPCPAPEINPVINWVGSVTDGEQGNLHQLQAYAQSTMSLFSIQVRVLRGLSRQDSIKALRSSRQTPAILGQWQCDHHYVPCRIFKNISYGQPTFSNSEVIKEISDESFFEPDCSMIAQKTEEYLKNRNFSLENDILNRVKNEHTYVNRCQQILNMVEEVRK